MSKNYYTILGVEKSATKDDLKKAFHRMAHKYHPDKEGGDEGKFKEVNEAYQILSDDTKRQAYDQFGSEYANQTGAAGASGFSGFGNMDDFSGQSVEFDLGEIFGDMFGRRRSSGKIRKGSDISVDVEITLEEAAFGVEKKFSLNKYTICPTCSGSMATPGTGTKKCTSCEGKGKVVKVQATILGQFQTSSTCQTCMGVGTIPEKPCTYCRGQGVTKELKDISVGIPQGIDDGQMVRINGEGEAVGRNGVPGDLYITVHLKTHDRFTREGVHLRTTITIPFSKAALGDKILLTTLDGKTIKLKIPAGIQSGKVLRVPGKGVHAQGDLLVTIVVEIPTRLSRKAKKLLDELSQEGL